MRCPYCNLDDSRVVESRSADSGKRIRRRRECTKCLRRFTTFETIEIEPLFVIKKDGSREIFDRKKIFNGLLRACEKRPIPVEKIEKIVDKVDSNLQNLLEKEVESDYIGERVMQALKELDEVAYIRFASIYRQFKDVNTFMDEARKLIKQAKF